MNSESRSDNADEFVRWLETVAPELADDHARLRRLVTLLDRYQSERWHRRVSIGDAIGDRWDRARRLGFGEGSSIYDTALVIGDVKVGRDTWIGPSTVLDGSGGLTIGDTCSISAGVQIYTHDTVLWALSGGHADVERAPTSIGSRTYIGPNAVITRGVTVGSGCVIGASSLVLHDIPNASVAHGTPARVTEDANAFLARKRSRNPEAEPSA